MKNDITNIEEKDLTLVIKSQTLGELVTNANDIKKIVEDGIGRYNSENYSEKNIDQAKKDKATLNKAAKSLNDKRIELEKEFNKPFAEFKAIIADTVTLIKEASSKIDDVVKTVEDAAKEKKKAEIMTYFNSKDFSLVPFENVFDQSWLNKSASMSSVRKHIDDIIVSIKNDLQSLDAMDDSDTLKAYYLDCLNLSETLLYASKMKENKARMSSSKGDAYDSTSSVEATRPTPQCQVSDTEEIFERSFFVRGTRSQLIALAEYMNNNHIYFQKI